MSKMKRKPDLDTKSSSEIATVMEEPISETTVIDVLDDTHSDDNSDSSSGCNDSVSRLFMIIVEKPHFQIQLTQKILIENLEQIQSLVQKIAGCKIELNTDSTMNIFGQKRKKSKRTKKKTAHHYEKIYENNDSHSVNKIEIKKESEDENLRDLKKSSRLEVLKSYPPNASIISDSAQLPTTKDQTSFSNRNVETSPKKDVQNMNSLLGTYEDMDNGDLDYLDENMDNVEPLLENYSCPIESNEFSCTSRVQSTSQLDQTTDFVQGIKWEPELDISDDAELINRASNNLSKISLLETIKHEPLENSEPVSLGMHYGFSNMDGTIETSLIDPKPVVKDEPVEEKSKVDKEVELVTLSDRDVTMNTPLIDPKPVVKDEPNEEKSKVDKEVELVTLSDMDDTINTPLIDPKPVVKDEPVEEKSKVDKEVELVTLSDMDDTINTPLFDPKPVVKDEPVEEKSKVDKEVEVVILSDTDDNDDDDDKKLDVNSKIELKSGVVKDNGVEIADSGALSKYSITSGSNENIHTIELLRCEKRKKTTNDEGDEMQKKKSFKYSEEDSPNSAVTQRSKEPYSSRDENKNDREKTISEQGNGLKRRSSESDELIKEIYQPIDSDSYSNRRKADSVTTRRSQERCLTSIEHHDKNIVENQNNNEENISHNDNLSHHKKANVNKTLRNEKISVDQKRSENKNNFNRNIEKLTNRVVEIDVTASMKLKYKNTYETDGASNRRNFSKANPEISSVHNTNDNRKKSEVAWSLSIPNEFPRVQSTKVSEPINNPHSNKLPNFGNDSHNFENIGDSPSHKRASSSYKNCTESRQSNEHEGPPKKKLKNSASESTAKANRHLSPKAETKDLLNEEKPRVKIAQSASSSEKKRLKDIVTKNDMNTMKLPQIKPNVDVLGATLQLKPETGDKCRFQHPEDLTAKQAEETCLINEHYKIQDNIRECSEEMKGRDKSADQVNETVLYREMLDIHYGTRSEGITKNSNTSIVDSEKGLTHKIFSPKNNRIFKFKAQIHKSLDSQESPFLQVGINAGVISPFKDILVESNLPCTVEENLTVSKSKIEYSKGSIANREEKSNDSNALAAKKNRFSNVKSEIRKSLDAAKATLPKAGTSADSGNTLKNMHSETNMPCDMLMHKCIIETSKTWITDTEENSTDEKDTCSIPGTSAESLGSTNATITGFNYDIERKLMTSFIGRIPKISETQQSGMKNSRSPNDDEHRSSDPNGIYPGRSPLIEADQNKETYETGRMKVEGNAKQHPNQLPRLFPATNNAMGENNCWKWNLFLTRILHWNPLWLKKKCFRNVPQKIARKKEIVSMQPKYVTYDKYYSDAEDLLALNIWYNMTSPKEMDAMVEKGKTKFSIAGHSVFNETFAGMEIKETKIFLHVVVGKGENARQSLPSVGDLVFFDYYPKKEIKKGEIGGITESLVFAYVENVRSKNILRDNPSFNSKLLKFVKDPYDLLTYVVITKPIKSGIEKGRISEMQTLPYFNKNIRSIQALYHLRDSPLLSMVLHPNAKDFQLRPPTDSQNFSLVANNNLDEQQKEAITRITHAVLKGEPKICLIHGPPGTGKTKVIVNLLTQLYREGQYKKTSSFRILVCAQSNSAVDEIVMSMLKLRKLYDPTERLKMVRTGRTDMMQENVKKVSLSSLANKEVQRYIVSHQSSTPEKAEKAMTFIKEQITELRNKRNTAIKPDMQKRILRKILDYETKYHVTAKLHKNDKLDSKEKDSLQKTMGNTILEGAHVIASTLVGCCPRYMESIFDGENNPISVCIVDNAAESSEAETLLPLLLGVKTLVLVGSSHHETRSLLGRNKEVVGLNQSFFSRVQEVLGTQPFNPIIQFDNQYRMAYEVAQWPEKYFYGRPLCNVTNLAPLSLHSYKVFNLDSIQDENFEPVTINKFEGLFVTTIVYTMANHLELTHSMVPLRIGVLTLTKHQKKWIEDQIKERLNKIPIDRRKKLIIDVNTIDSFQGQERDVIIMSCVRTRVVGRLANRQSMCLALTRAKRSMIICGNFDAFEADPMWNDLLSDAKYRGVYSNLKWNIDAGLMKGHIMH